MSTVPCRRIQSILAAMLGIAMALPALSDTVNLTATKDASIFEESNTAANGAGRYFHVGSNGSGQARRALVQFDLSSIPAGSTITSVTLSLRMDDGGNSGPADLIEVRKLTQLWNEGPTNPDIASPGQGGGHGATAVAGDVTWHHRNYSAQIWTSDGGTFSGTISASASVTNVAGTKTWTSTNMKNDVAAWYATPSTNFGWLLKGDEAVNSTARRFSSRTNTTVSERPKLTVNYTPPAGTGACCAAAGTCTTVTSASCTAGGGTYQGNGVACNPCPQPTGGCCFGDGTCLILSSANCATQSGTYRGNGTSCSPACPVLTGACCRSNATCTVLSEAACDALPGTYQGDGVTCAAVTCNWVLAPFVDQLPIPATATPTSGVAGGAAHYDIGITEFFQSFHSSLPPTRVWGYAGSSPGPTIEARRNLTVTVNWINNLRNQSIHGFPLRTTHPLPVDTCLHGPNVTGVVPVTVTHLHGAHVRPDSDGFPDLAFPPGQSSPLYTYPNIQQPANLWYHDHALGITRLNVYMGLAGFYLIRDSREDALNLPQGQYEIPLVIQDRSFNADGSLKYNPTFQDHFFGDFITVNGKVWPYLPVNRGRYRFRMLNGSSTRTYTLSAGSSSLLSITMQQIGSDLGLLAAPVPITSLTLMPGERADVVIDFSNYTTLSRSIILRNSAVSPFPGGGDGPDVSTVMQFRATGLPGDTDPLPVTLTSVPRTPEASAVATRTFQLAKIFDNVCNHDMWLINSLMWDDITEFPVLGTTEIWRWVNRSGVSHPMHMHLVEFQVLDRQDFTVDGGGNIIPTPGTVDLPAANELGWKDTVQATPNQITRVIARFADYPGNFPFHCHILDHEDHEMMRQFTAVCAALTIPTQPIAATVRVSQLATFSMVAAGSPPYTYQWFKEPATPLVSGPSGSGSIYSGATSATLNIVNVQMSDAVRYFCTVTDPCGVSVSTLHRQLTVLCRADFNLSGSVSVQDIFDFLAAYFANDPSADFNGTGTLSVQDIFDFLAEFFTACP